MVRGLDVSRRIRRFVAAGALLVFAVALTAAPAQATCTQGCAPDSVVCTQTLAYPNGAGAVRMLPNFPYRAKDFSIIKVNNLYHLVYLNEDRTVCPAGSLMDAITFGHATSPDLENWTSAGTILGAFQHPWDDLHLWAPTLFVKDVYVYMFFTGVDDYGNQRIGGARTRWDSDPNLIHWTELPAGSIDQANPSLTCGVEVPSCLCDFATTNMQFRDPFVMRDTQLRNNESVPGWLMYYTTIPQNLPTGSGGARYIVNVARASYDDPSRWRHLLQLSSTHFSTQQFSHLIESPHLLQHGSTWYLFFTGDQGIEYVTGTNPLGDQPYDWGNHTILKTMLGAPFAGYHPENWFASETFSDAGHDYLLNIHDFNPPVGDPLCQQNKCVEVRPVEIREMLWSGTTFTLAEPNPVRVADWAQSSAGPNCFTDLNLTVRDPKSRVAEMSAVRLLAGGGEELLSMASIGFPTSVNLGTGTTVNLHRRIQNPTPGQDAQIKVRITNQAKVIDSDVITVTAGNGCSSGGGGGGPFEIPESHTPPRLPTELALRAHTQARNVSFEIDMPTAGHVTLELFEVTGRQVRTVFEGEVAAGTAKRAWDGEDGRGNRMRAGVYFARLVTENGTKQTRVVVK